MNIIGEFDLNNERIRQQNGIERRKISEARELIKKLKNRLI